MSDANHKELMDLLKTILKVQALSAVSGLESKKAKILFLIEAGLAPKEVAVIVGSSPASVNQVAYEARKRAKED